MRAWLWFGMKIAGWIVYVMTLTACGVLIVYVIFNAAIGAISTNDPPTPPAPTTTTEPTYTTIFP